MTALGYRDQQELFLPRALQLRGRDAKATIFLDGQVIGRWLSDDQWISRGTWLDVRRDLWATISPDHFPLLPSMLTGKKSHRLVVLFEDASVRKGSRGDITSVGLVPNQERDGLAHGEFSWDRALYRERFRAAPEF